MVLYLVAILFSFLVAISIISGLSIQHTANWPHLLPVQAKWWERWSLVRRPPNDLPVASSSIAVYPYSFTGKSHSTEVHAPSRENREAFARALWERLEAKGEFSSCWKDALASLHMRCDPIEKSEGGILKEALRTRLAFHLAKCDAEEDGRSPSMFQCKDEWTDIRRCVKSMTEPVYTIFIQYRLHADVLCAYLKEEIFQQRTEAAVAALHEETIAAVASTIKIEELEEEMINRIKESIRAQVSSEEALQQLEKMVQTMNQQHQSSMNSAESSVRDLLETSDIIHNKWRDLHKTFQEAAEIALESIYQLSNLTMLQLDQIQFTTHSIREELRDLESAQESLLSSFPQATVLWLMEIIAGSAIILLFTALPITSPARVPAMSWWVFCAGFLSFLSSMGSNGMHAGARYHRLLICLSFLPWDLCGGVGSAICILGTVIFWRKNTPSFFLQDTAALLQLLQRDSRSNGVREIFSDVQPFSRVRDKKASLISFFPFSRLRRGLRRVPVPSPNSCTLSPSLSTPRSVMPQSHSPASDDFILPSKSYGNIIPALFSSPPFCTKGCSPHSHSLSPLENTKCTSLPSLPDAHEVINDESFTKSEDRQPSSFPSLSTHLSNRTTRFQKSKDFVSSESETEKKRSNSFKRGKPQKSSQRRKL